VRKVFSIGVLVVLSYYLTWYLFRALELNWHTAWNIPGLALIACSFPWSLPVTSNVIELAQLLGKYGRDALMVLVVALGFALNLTILKLTFDQLRKLRSRNG